jgi:hypothetical protein
MAISRNLQVKKNRGYFFSSGFFAFLVLQLKNINAGATLRLIVGTVLGASSSSWDFRAPRNEIDEDDGCGSSDGAARHYGACRAIAAADSCPKT